MADHSLPSSAAVKKMHGTLPLLCLRGVVVILYFTTMKFLA
jgi:hypothetical protein